MMPDECMSYVDGRGHLLIVGTTNRPNALDPALRRPGRLDQEILIGMPSEQERSAILLLHSSRMPLSPDVDISYISKQTHGYSGADLASLCREAAMIAFSSRTGGHRNRFCEIHI